MQAPCGRIDSGWEEFTAHLTLYIYQRTYSGGAYGARTRDLLTASQALSQLSYTPMRIYSVLFKPRRSFDCGASGGDKGIRTPDLLNANQALSQLSYTPRRKIYYIIQILVWQDLI